MKKLFNNEKRLKTLVIALIITITLLMGVSYSAFAQTTSGSVSDGAKTTSSTPIDDENVYVMTKTDGSAYQRIVSADGTLHYKGYDSYTLPISMKVTYTLDGKSVTASELAGKSGHVVIHISYTNNIKSGGVNVPFMVVTGMAFDNNNFSNVTVDNGKTMDDGSRNMVMGYSLPGLSSSLGVSKSDVDIPESVTINADTDNYKVDTMYTVVTNKVFQDVDFSKVDSLSQLTSKIGQLKTAANKIVSGTDKLAAGSDKLAVSAKKLSNASVTIKNGSKGLYDGSEALKSGLSALYGADANVDGTQKLAAGASKVSSGASNLADGLSKSQAKLKSDEIMQSAIDSVNNEIHKKYTGVPTLTTSNYDSTLTNTITALTVEMKKYTSGSTEHETYAVEIADLKGVKNTLDSVKTVYSGMAASLDKAVAGSSQVSAGAKQVSDGAAKINSAVGQQLIPGASKLVAGAKELNKGTVTFSSKQAEFAKGASTLAAGAKELDKGLNEAMTKVSGQLSKLSKSDLTRVIKNAKSVSSAARSYNSFGGNGSYKAVNFIYKTDEVSPTK